MANSNGETKPQSVLISPEDAVFSWFKIKGYVIPTLSILLFGMAWELFSYLSAISPVLLPPPSAALVRLVEMMGPGDDNAPSYLLLRHIGATMVGLLVGFFAAALVSSAIGLLMGVNKTIYEWFNPIISLFMVIPTVAIVPVIILWSGLGMKTVIIIVALGASFPIIFTAAAGVQSIPKKMIWAAQTAGATRRQILLTVIIPATMPYLITGHKLALGRAWRAVLAGEIFASTAYGIGFMIYDARTFLDTQAMFAGLIIVGIFGLILQSLFFRYIEKSTIERWGIVSQKDI
jgi:ABC-type nitrate/sulfonate/bicarbonate transport system permease component